MVLFSLGHRPMAARGRGVVRVALPPPGAKQVPCPLAPLGIEVGV